MASPAAVASASASAAALSHLIRHVSTTCTADLRPEYRLLVKKVALLSHLLDEIDEFFSRSDAACGEGSSAPPVNPTEGLDQLLAALRAAKRFLSLGQAGRTCQAVHSYNADNVRVFRLSLSLITPKCTKLDTRLTNISYF